MFSSENLLPGISLMSTNSFQSFRFPYFRKRTVTLPISTSPSTAFFILFLRASFTLKNGPSTYRTNFRCQPFHYRKLQPSCGCLPSTTLSDRAVNLWIFHLVSNAFLYNFKSLCAAAIWNINVPRQKWVEFTNHTGALTYNN